MPPPHLLASATPGESAWVEGELIRNLMATSRSTRYVGPVVVAVFVAVGWGTVPIAWQMAWASGALLIWLARLLVDRHYALRVVHADTAAHLAFMRRFGFLWPASAFWWGLSAAMFFERTPVPNQFVAWLIIAGIGSFSLNSYSSHLALMRSYVNVLALAIAGVVLARIVALEFHGPIYHWWMLALVALYWQMLLRGGLRLHETYRRNFELLYRNNMLIQSLTRQTQAALDAVAVKNRFLASATHDIRQPVHALSLYADWLRDEPDLVREIAPKIVESTKAINTLFDALFDLARLDAGQVRVSIEPIDMPRLMHELELQYRPLARARGLELRIRARAGTVVSDPIRLKRILGNFISNAIKYTVRGGVLVAARPTVRGMRVEVWDTGVGIANHHLGDIFREFYKVPAHAGTDDGFGLGLAIVTRLASALGHRVQVKSRQGRGSVFSVAVEGAEGHGARLRAEASIAAQLASRP